MDLLATNESAVKDLSSAGLCRCCQFRALTGNLKELYSGSPVTELIELQLKPDSTQNKLLVCSICLGVTRLVDTIAEKVIEKINSQMYEPSDFSISIAIPPDILVREKIIELKFGLRFKFELKDVLRQYIEMRLKQMDKWEVCNLVYKSSHHQVGSSEIFANLNINIRFDYKASDEESRQFKNFLYWQKTHPNKRKHPESGYKKLPREKLIKSLKTLTLEDDKGKNLVAMYPPSIPNGSLFLREIDLVRDIVYITGRYNKFSRDISQTAWFINGRRKGDFSIEEIISNPLVIKYRADGFKFSAAGREDIDVRMLGNGRPFVVQLINCRVSVDSILAQEKLIIESLDEKSPVQVSQLKISSAECMKIREQGEKFKKKHYVAVIWVDTPLSENKMKLLHISSDILVQQLTPIRVMHRRALLKRNKVIHSMSPHKINDNFLLLKLCTSAGTYVKEFVHGDMGRTQPSIASILGCEADIIQLDVERLDMGPDNI